MSSFSLAPFSMCVAVALSVPERAAASSVARAKAWWACVVAAVNIFSRSDCDLRHSVCANSQARARTSHLFRISSRFLRVSLRLAMSRFRLCLAIVHVDCCFFRRNRSVDMLLSVFLRSFLCLFRLPWILTALSSAALAIILASSVESLSASTSCASLLASLRAVCSCLWSSAMASSCFLAFSSAELAALARAAARSFSSCSTLSWAVASWLLATPCLASSILALWVHSATAASASSMSSCAFWTCSSSSAILFF
mmetsp:Transcript_80448/g.120889  ORF Transcript_80448/g.120889 Transcript_80448/m.120889 type:complete len:255 (+) Transcript_80448:1494-2258(+)